MALELTTATLRALQETSIEPNIVVEFDGLDVLFSAKAVKEFIKINDPGFFIGSEGYFIGGLFDVDPETNKTLIDSQSTTFSIKQQINHDEGKSSSISSMTIGLVDKDEYVTLVISPGQVLEDVLGRQVTVSITYGDVSFFEDSIQIFKGFVTEVNSTAGLVKFKINHPDNKKNVKLFKKVSTAITSAINASQTTIAVDDASGFYEAVDALGTYLRIGSEVIEYTNIVGNTFTGCVRGSLGSIAAPHDDNSTVNVIYSLEDNPLTLAMKIMMSGHGTDPIYENIAVSSFLQIGAGITQVANAIYFDQVNVPQKYGLRVGDTVTITGATNAANNVTNATVVEVVQSESGYYIVLSGVSLVLENVTSAVMQTFTQFNVFPDGMRMKPDEVDIDEHEKIRDFFHSTTQMRFYIKEDELEGKEFIEGQLYRPIACYALPRKATSSVGYTVGPIPGEDIKTLDISSVKVPRQLSIKRTTARSFFNEVVYKYEDSPLTEDEVYTRGKIFISADSKNRIPGGNRTFEIEAQGLRTDLNAQNIVDQNAGRILDRYKFAAEIVNAQAMLRVGIAIEVGDIVVGSFKDLQVSDSTRGDRQFKERLFEVLNKSLNIKTGQIDFQLLDTGLGLETRYALVSPCSPIVGVISSAQFVIGPDPFYGGQFGDDEFRKWVNVIDIANPISILVRNADYSIQEDLVVTNINENTFTLQSPASITLTEGLMVEFTGYVDEDVSNKQKLIYGWMTDDLAFPDGENPYTMI